ncbi:MULTISPECIES: MOSC domain-containing protein [unclassified Dermacoccus]|uniref:MOSC domain-containing protein n=1 Tax=unclassified Dermacoccus TaxID=2643059 RepID=UPI0006996975|nr:MULTISPECIES: MOSC domain-containing protein [unclassified Dermacoccus]MBZ4496742.1 MOSC domain-containing protein [Dermacoccus sp. Tok2021]RYI22708.1 MOSC domain-containing protein [Dermacoccus sp. 147Ba]
MADDGVRETSAAGPNVLSVNVGRPEEWDPKQHRTGIHKQPVGYLEVSDPGPREGGGRSGVAGDFVGDEKHHGGSDKAVYLVAREELDHWERELGRSLPNASFGENVTTSGIDLDGALVGTRWRVGTAVLEASLPRIPCRTFAWAMDVPGWLKRFTQRGRAGTYARVVEPGRISAGDDIVEVYRPAHGITVADVFSARTTGGRDVLARVVEAGVLPSVHQRDYEARLRK